MRVCQFYQPLGYISQFTDARATFGNTHHFYCCCCGQTGGVAWNVLTPWACHEWCKITGTSNEYCYYCDGSFQCCITSSAPEFCFYVAGGHGTNAGQIDGGFFEVRCWVEQASAGGLLTSAFTFPEDFDLMVGTGFMNHQSNCIKYDILCDTDCSVLCAGNDFNDVVDISTLGKTAYRFCIYKETVPAFSETWPSIQGATFTGVCLCQA